MVIWQFLEHRNVLVDANNSPSEFFLISEIVVYRKKTRGKYKNKGNGKLKSLALASLLKETKYLLQSLYKSL